MRRHASWKALQQSEAPPAARCFAFTTRAAAPFGEARFEPGDWLIFGSETSGLPEGLLASFAPTRSLRLPMRPGQRSLNLSNAVAVVVFEAWRQQGYAGSE